MKCAPPFSFQGFPTFVGHKSPYRCAGNFIIVKLKFELNYYAYTYSFFDNIFHTVCFAMIRKIICFIAMLDHILDLSVVEILADTFLLKRARVRKPFS